jgi:L-seryl-tRNA(Ser) seleniumtransferase
MTIAALEATLRLYRDPDRLSQRLPALRLLTRSPVELKAQAERLRPALQAALGERAEVKVIECRSQIGSGSLPVDRLDSAGLAIASPTGGKRSGAFPEKMARALRELPIPVIGRIEDGELRLDLRGLDGQETERRFLQQLPLLALPR